MNGTENAVVTITNEKTDELVYSIRIKGNTFKPKVFENGTYTISIGNPEEDKWVEKKGIKSTGEKGSISVDL